MGTIAPISDISSKTSARPRDGPSGRPKRLDWTRSASDDLPPRGKTEAPNWGGAVQEPIV